MDKYTGKRLDGRYEIHEIVGVGGMAVVYRAHDTIDDRTVAIKILKDEFLGNADFIRRFKNESKAIAVLSHPNIVKVFDVSFGDRIQYIVEEYIDGITLKEYLDQQKQIKWKEAIHFTVQILRALQHAHEKGIVHRDIKPQNIMLLQDGTIKVTDFGIARFSRNETRTMTDRAIGSVHYIAPEQARGDLTDEKTDLYSVGVMLYEMLTGQLPFEADNAVSVAIMQLQNDPRPLREINPEIPEGLEEITLRAMQKNPEQRYQSAADMLRDIETFRRNPSTRFQYKYFVDEKPTKYIDAINAVKSPEQPYYNDNYEYVEESAKPGRKKRSVATLVVAGIAAAFLIVALGIVVAVVYHNFNTEPADVTLPDFAGKKYTDVANDSSYKFKFTEQQQSDATHAAGIVIKQNPKAGTTVKENASITLIVSSGPKQVTVPDLSGKAREDAETSLAQLGLTAKVAEIPDENVDSGLVIRTDPVASTQVAAGATVTVYVSMGKAVQKVAVPNVVGETLENAKADITAKGLTVGQVTQKDDSGKDQGIVLETDPLNGVQLDKGKAVNLVVSSGKSSQKTVDVFVQLPKGVTHDIELKAYLDGDLQTTKTVNPSYNDVVQLSFSGKTGTHTLTVALDGNKYNVFSLNFDTGKPSLTETDPYVESAGNSSGSGSSSSEGAPSGSITPSP